MSSRRALIAVALAFPVFAGCGSPDQDAVSAAAQSLYDAVGHQDGTAGCAALTPKAAQSLESGGSRCPEEIVKLGLQGGPIGDVEVWGDRAKVHAGTDTVFLAKLGGTGWRVAAAGCQERPGQPYECDLEA